MGTYAIGDIQGCMGVLDALLAQIDYRPGRDQLWLAGDLVNRGPRSLDVLRWARDQDDSVVAVLGNHDLHLLACAAGVRQVGRRDTFTDVLEAPDRDELVSWLRHRPLLHREGHHLLVHAGLLPPWTADAAAELAREVEDVLRGPHHAELLGDWTSAPDRWRDDLSPRDRRTLTASALTTLRCVDAAGAMDRDFNRHPREAPPGLVPWFDHPARRSRHVRVLCGHWAALGLHLAADVAALDSGAVYGRGLTALCLGTGTTSRTAAIPAT